VLLERRIVTDQAGFQEQIKQLSDLITRFEQMPDSPQKATGKELVQLLMEVHAQGLERILEIAFDSGSSGRTLIDSLGRDDVAGGLLLLYSLHPDALETRVHTALERLRPRLRKLSCTAELLSIDEGAVRVQVTKSGHSCGSSADEVQTMVENGLYELAPDIASLEVVGLEEQVSSGFVALESLLAPALVASSSGHEHHSGAAG
jgi:Fe-S cluster biogenesis protein NfuA